MGFPEDQQKQEERRGEPRVRGAVIDYSLESEKSFKKTAFIKDISVHGLCIYVFEKVELNSILYMDIHLFGSSVPIKTKGKVLWTKKAGYLNYDYLGMEFVEMDESDKQILSQHIILLVQDESV